MTALLPMKPAPNDRLQFKCPACGAWRPGFVFTAPNAADAAELALANGTNWICDNDRSHLMRVRAAAAEAKVSPAKGKARV